MSETSNASKASKAASNASGVIKNLSKSDSFKIKTPEPLPNLPFRMLACGPTSSGKSNYIMNLITRPEMLKSYFVHKDKDKGETMDRVYIFSPSMHLNNDWDEVKTRHKFQPEKFKDVEDKLLNILTTQEKYIKQHGKKAVYHLLIILDDCAAMRGFHESNILRTLFFRGRHALISIILTSQSYKAFPKKARANCSHWALFRPQSMAEADELSKDLVRKKDQAVVADTFQKIWSVPYSFIYIQNELPNVSKRYMVNMQTYLNLDGESGKADWEEVVLASEACPPCNARLPDEEVKDAAADG